MRRLMIHAVLSATLAVALSPALAQSPAVKVDDAWVRATVSQQRSTGAFMQMTAEKPLKIVAVSSPLTPMVEIHEMKMEDGVMKMRAVDVLPLPAGQLVELKPGGFHVMLMGLKAPVKVGETVPLTFTLEDAAGQRSKLEVQARGRAGLPRAMQ